MIASTLKNANGICLQANISLNVKLMQLQSIFAPIWQVHIYFRVMGIIKDYNMGVGLYYHATGFYNINSAVHY
jgi:hypothetical protein